MSRLLALAPVCAAVIGLAVAVPALAPARAEDAKIGGASVDDPVVATVAGHEIFLSDIEDARRRAPAPMRAMAPADVFGTLLESLIDTKLAAAAARGLQLDSERLIQRKLKLAEENILQRAFLDHVLTKELTEEKLRAAYEGRKDELPKVGKIDASHIVLASEESAREVIKRLEAGEDFAEIAKSTSLSRDRDEGGRLGLTPLTQFPKPFAEAAMPLKAGEFTKDPVQTKYGWHVILVNAHQEPATPSFEDVEADIRADLAAQVTSQYRKALRDQAEIKRFNPDGTPFEDSEGEPKEEMKKEEMKK